MSTAPKPTKPTELISLITAAFPDPTGEIGDAVWAVIGDIVEDVVHSVYLAAMESDTVSEEDVNIFIVEAMEYYANNYE